MTVIRDVPCWVYRGCDEHGSPIKLYVAMIGPEIPATRHIYEQEHTQDRSQDLAQARIETELSHGKDKNHKDKSDRGASHGAE